MRPGPWILLPWFLLSIPATAQEHPAGQTFQRRTLVVPARPGEVPPVELHVAVDVATLVQFEAPLKPGAPKLPEHEERIQLGPTSDDSMVILLTRPLADGERVTLTLDAGPGAAPLRFVLVTRHDVVDARVRVVHAWGSTDEDGAEYMARSLLGAPDARATLDVPQEAVKYNTQVSRGRVKSMLWVGRRLFATVTVRSRKQGTPPWKLVQARLRATLADGVLLEWPAHLLSGAANPTRQQHVLTSLVPEGASQVELALDGEDSPGVFRPLSLEEEPVRP
ncbi:DUF2381 family protein [Archangium violaceum]|uniref:DUF2381 family protein n=1 Tax=Archangium violaceum TaxID=83451 RepID=UPI001951EE1C|nr:DUF2381 family protein [Archangium violaceum]QRN94870.1 DUF2381 family protein [Archangium violaceum]